MRANQTLDQLTRCGELVEKQPNDDLRCLACAHRCLIHPGNHGICRMRRNQNGVLLVPYGYVAGMQIDPIEKKPFSHFLPGSQVLTFGMLGCNFHCSFCQNWFSSQALREPASEASTQLIHTISAEELVETALINKVASIASSYNEPSITPEWAKEIFSLAHKNGLKTAMVSNGFFTPESLKWLRPDLDALKIDLKSMREEQYKKIGGRLQPVLDTIQLAYQSGLWVEVVTLVIPGFNDSNEELWQAGRFISSISTDIPWHVTAYHPDYQMQDAPPTPSATLQRAAEIGQEAGLRYVYAGNLPGKVGSLEDTYCPNCTRLLVQRRGFRVVQNQITLDGTCSYCGVKIPGLYKY